MPFVCLPSIAVSLSLGRDHKVDSSFLTGLKIAHKSPQMTRKDGGGGRKGERREGIGTLAGGSVGRLPSGDPLASPASTSG